MVAVNHSVKFIYLDIGDTLIAEVDMGLVAKALNLGKKVLMNDYQKYRMHMYKGTSTPSDFVESIKDKLSMSKKDAIDKWNKALKNLRVIKPMQKLVRDLSVKYKIGLLTNIYKGHFEIFYNAGKIPHISYDAVIKSCDVGFAKPEKEIYEIAVKKAKVSSREILLIDNKSENVEAGIKYGWQGLAFDSKNPVESVNKLRSILL